MSKIKLSVVLATRNEEKNLDNCLKSVANIADEIIVVDEYSDDATRDIAAKYGAKIYLEKHQPIFHVTKQKALDKANGEWILQLDADEVVSEELSREIKKVLSLDNEYLLGLKVNESKLKLFEKHQELLEQRDGKIGKETGEVVGFFIARRNIFLGKPLTHAGVYPDGVIRLVKNGKAYFPQKSVHEQIVLDGEVRWLENDLDHYDSPTFRRYLSRANRYTDLSASEYKAKKLPKNPANILIYSLFLPVKIFISLFFRHKGFLDRAPGFIWSFFSALHPAIAYFKYLTSKE